MEIAPGIQAAEWHRLSLDNAAGEDWTRAVEILECRIKERYIDAIDCLVQSEHETLELQRRFGFVILAVDCLLIETLGAFALGLENTERNSKSTFCSFLTTRRAFSSIFTLELAEQFYKEYRCGILHQAEIQGNSRVWSFGPLIQHRQEALIVNRTLLHNLLKTDFSNYLDELRDPNNADLRSNFRRKMDFIGRTQ